MEYTNEFLARVYGAYLGCETTYLDEEGGKCNVNLQTIDYMLHEKEVSGQLSLIPLPEMSDEDAIEVAKIYKSNVRGYSKGAEYIDNKEWYRAGVEFCMQLADGKTATTNRGNFISAIDFLRSKGYDCGYGEIPSLIKARIAIKKQKP